MFNYFVVFLKGKWSFVYCIVFFFVIYLVMILLCYMCLIYQNFKILGFEN